MCNYESLYLTIFYFTASDLFYYKNFQIIFHAKYFHIYSYQIYVTPDNNKDAES